MILLSIIIPVYNQENLVIEAINSIPKRTDLEIIVIDDGSTDNTYPNLLNLRRKFCLIHLTKNKSVGYCRNLGLKRARGEFICWLDSDDKFDTIKFNSFIDFVYTHRWCDVIHVDLLETHNNGKIVNGPTSCATTSKVTKLSFIKKNNLKFEDINCGEDLIFWNDIKKLKFISSHYKDIYYLYNYPRQGSITWLSVKGIIPMDWKNIKR